MASFQKFKLLMVAQCAVAGSPTRSPTASPVIHLRRKKTLRMLLGGRALPDEASHDSDEGTSPEKSGEEFSSRHKLKDLFVSSPPPSEDHLRERLLTTTTSMSHGAVRGTGYRSLRPLSATIRQRLMRRAWRPVLVAIPE